MNRRLTGTVIFAVLLSGVFAAAYFLVARTVVRQQKLALNAKWMAVKGYLRFSSHGADWFYDAYDPDQSFIVSQLQHIYLLADSSGRPVQVSEVYQRAGLPAPAEVRA